MNSLLTKLNRALDSLDSEKKTQFLKELARLSKPDDGSTTESILDYKIRSAEKILAKVNSLNNAIQNKSEYEIDNIVLNIRGLSQPWAYYLPIKYTPEQEKFLIKLGRVLSKQNL